MKLDIDDMLIALSQQLTNMESDLAYLVEKELERQDRAQPSSAREESWDDVTHSIPYTSAEDTPPWEDERLLALADFANADKLKLKTNKEAITFVKENGLPHFWSFPGVSKVVVLAVLQNTGVGTAADELNLLSDDLYKILHNSGIQHFHGEKWTLALRRALNQEDAVDAFVYPEEWKKKGNDFIRQLKGGAKISDLAKTEGTRTQLLARFLSNNGFNVKGEKISC
jgi:hypothetical protein